MSEACGAELDYMSAGASQAPWAAWDSMEQLGGCCANELDQVTLGGGGGDGIQKSTMGGADATPWPLLTTSLDAPAKVHVAEEVAAEALMSSDAWGEAKISPPPGLEDVFESRPARAASIDQAGGACEPIRDAWDAGPQEAELDSPQFAECKWHSSAKNVGVVSADGHVFTKTDTGGKKIIMSSRGVPVELSSICMVFDSSLRCGGVHRYNYQILDGEPGAADGAGFVFDKQVRRNNIQRMRSVFLNQRGRICVRDNGHVSKLRAQLPPLSVGMWLTLHIDLDQLCLQFAVFDANGALTGIADVSLPSLMNILPGGEMPNSGFFCAVVTKDISVGLA